MLPCKHTSGKPTLSMHVHSSTSTDHPPCIEWESDDDSDLPDEVWAENVKATKSKSQSEEWESSMAKRASGRESKVGVCNERRQSMKPRSRGLGVNSFSSRVTAAAASPQTQHCRIWTGSLTDLAVAEMYWTTISRFVLRSFSRSGALRSSFRFMSSWRHKRQGESYITVPVWMENLLQNCFILLIVVLSSHGVNLKQKQMRYTIKRTHFQFIWIHSKAKEIALMKLNKLIIFI